jgi:UDP-N-acetylmuramoyl-L-alanyl-D-glutamate--2,6-diaminopimelate ligase
MMLSRIVTEQSVPEIDIQGITDDSRQVKAGDLFLAVRGETVDGRDYLQDAIRKGALAAVCEAPAPVLTEIPVIPLEELSSRAGVLASRFYGEPSEQMTIVAVTGTNGKTSFTHLLASALRSRHIDCGLVGTMGYGRPGSLKDPGLTTPPAVDLQRRLKDLLVQGCEVTVLEASSHGIVQHRLAGCQVDIAVLTNITHDHLDYHKTMEAYRSAKEQLFHLPGLRSAVVNRDDEFAPQLISRLPGSVECIDFSMQPGKSVGTKVSLEAVVMHERGMRLSIKCLEEVVKADLPLFGSFNVQNILAVAATLVAMGWAGSDIEQALGALEPVAGRMEVLSRAGKPTFVIDYAHTPDALEKVLAAIREHYPDRNVNCVFGCGGDRDKMKRPIMGRIASLGADHVIVTSDNPRSEDPRQIIREITAGIEGEYTIETDREAAIRQALSSSDEQDVILLAGKGHENYQELAGGRIPFSDIEVVRTALGIEDAIVGIGATGLSYARYLKRAGRNFVVYDDKPPDSSIAELRDITAEAVEIRPLRELQADKLMRVYLSPGVPLAQENIRRVREAGVPVLGDVAMFGELARAPVVAITGTNGKSTVAHLVHALLADQKDKVVLAGNVGTPVLDVLADDTDIYVLEASSYQLELADQLAAEVAVVLNLSPDHLDRYPDLETYYQTKLALYDHCQSAVINRNLAVEVKCDTQRIATFGTDGGDKEGDFGLVQRDGEFLLTNGSRELISAGELPLSGVHNLENILAALAIGWLLELDMAQMLKTLAEFKGLAHRGELVAELDGIRFVNDSKATNPGAMVSAVKGARGALHLIAGGDAKGLDFVAGVKSISSYISSLALIGANRSEMVQSLAELDVKDCASMDEAVRYLAAKARDGDTVLLSPGCASLDQYENYMARGEAFREAVKGLAS